ncbi:MAG: anti-sigma factor [Bryobacteraceae bacterium]|nr:anti-sigma factor [Bryobacteraceae bacterium]
MTCEELRDEYELFALGLSEGAERRELESHLERRCPVCTPGVAAAMHTVAALALLAEPQPLPARLRKRLMAALGVDSPSWFSWPMLIPAALALAGLLLWVQARAGWQAAERALASSRAQVEQQAKELGQLRPVLAFLNQPGTKLVNFGAGPTGSILVNAREGVLLMASNLPALPAGRTYQMWLIPKGGAPQSAGLFQAAANGTALHARPGLVPAETSAVAISVEPEAGSTAPTTTPILVAPVTGF